MKEITQYSCDWKESFDFKKITKMINDLTKEEEDKVYLYEYAQAEVDSKVLYISTVSLNKKQLDQLWGIGDLYTGDKIWRAKDFKGILLRITEHIDYMHARTP